MGSSPASPETWPSDGSMTSGVQKKFRNWGPVDGILISYLLACGKDLTRPIVRRNRIVSGIRSHGRGGCPAEALALSVLPMTDVTSILSAIQQGDPHAAAQLLPLVYDKL